MQPYNFIYILFEGKAPLRYADSPLCGYAATEGGKAKRDAPPGRTQPAVRGHAPKASGRRGPEAAEPPPLPE